MKPIGNINQLYTNNKNIAITNLITVKNYLKNQDIEKVDVHDLRHELRTPCLHVSGKLG